MVLNLASILSSVYSYITLFFMDVAASYILIPGTSIIIGSYAAFTGNVNSLIFLMIFVFISSIIGDLSAYFLARHYSDKALHFLRRFKFFNKNESKTRDSLKKYEFTFVFFSRFLVSGSGAAVNYIGGFEKLNRKKFIVAVLAGEAVYSVMYPLIGYLFKDTWMELINTIQNAFLVIFLSLIGIYLIYKIGKYFFNRRK